MSEILFGLIAMNNRATEAFKIWLKERAEASPENFTDEGRRFATLLFSLLFGLGSAGLAITVGGLSFANTPLAQFENAPLALVVVVGAMTSFGGALGQYVLDLIKALESRTIPNATVVQVIEEPAS